MSGSPFFNVPDQVYQAAREKTGHLARQGFCLAAIHPYTTPEGVPTWWVLRFESDQIDAKTGKKAKRILPLHRTDSGFEVKRPEFGANGSPLYNLHLLATYPEDLVYLVEGEACADCLVKLGLIATTWPNGALALGKADLSPLGNRKVICWPDNDEPGLRAMLEAQARLQTMGALALLLDVHAMGLPPKGDAVDWLDKFIQRRSAVELCAVPGGFEAALEEVQCLPVWLRKAAA